MNRLILFGLIASLSFAWTGPLHAEEPATAEEIIAASDAVRNPDKPFSLKTTLIEYRSGKESDRMVLIVYSKEEKSGGQYRTLVRFFDPASKASVRISPQQRLMGQASNGDVVTVNFHKDYKGTIEGVETITDAEKNSRNCYRVNMIAANDSVTYHRIEYWVEKESYQPVKGKFYSESERLLKTAYYRNYQEQLGKRRPTDTIIIDGVDSKLVTKMSFSDYNYRDIPEEWFQKEYLPRFKGN
jgi:ribosomal protein L24